jgi:hypothetical protein
MLKELCEDIAVKSNSPSMHVDTFVADHTIVSVLHGGVMTILLTVCDVLILSGMSVESLVIRNLVILNWTAVGIFSISRNMPCST